MNFYSPEVMTVIFDKIRIFKWPVKYNTRLIVLKFINNNGFEQVLITYIQTLAY